jgi:hypothetical protein
MPSSFPYFGGVWPIKTRRTLSEQETLELMVEFIMSELDMYSFYKAMGQSVGYFHLGKAAHPLMDWMCPSHDLKPWAGSLPEYLPHLLYDFRISDIELREAATFTREHFGHDDWHPRCTFWVGLVKIKK